jgi:hypothetical protein
MILNYSIQSIKLKNMNSFKDKKTVRKKLLTWENWKNMLHPFTQNYLPVDVLSTDLLLRTIDIIKVSLKQFDNSKSILLLFLTLTWLQLSWRRWFLRCKRESLNYKNHKVYNKILNRMKVNLFMRAIWNISVENTINPFQNKTNLVYKSLALNLLF